MPDPAGLGPELADGLAAYRAGRFWEAHERWERVWRRSAGEERRRVQALIMLAAAAWHVERGREHPARVLLGRAAAHLAGARGRGLAEATDAALAGARLALPPVHLG